MTPIEPQRPLEQRRTCGAKTRGGTPCQRSPAPGRNRCNLHGGKTPRGIAAPNWKTGRWSKVLPRGLVARYEQAVGDRRLLELRDDIALLDARTNELLSKVDQTHDSAALWRATQVTFTRLSASMQAKDADAITEHLTALGQLLNSGVADTELWHEIQSLIDQRRKLVESESRRLVELGSVLTVEQAMAFSSAVLAAVKSNVADPQALTAISEAVTRLLNVEGAENSEFSEPRKRNSA